MSNYTLKIGPAGPANFDTLGITGCTISQTTWARDSATLTTAEAIDSGDLIPPFARCEIADLSGVVRFVGWLQQAPRRAAPQSEQKTYTLHGPITQLSSRIYRDPDQAAGALLGYRTPTETDPPHRTIREELVKLCGIIRALGISLSDPPGGALEITPPWQSFHNTTYLNALETVMRFAPAWALVSNGAALSWIDTLTSPSHAISTLAADLSDVALNPHYDLLRREVKIHYIRTETLPGERGIFSRHDNWGPGGDALAMGATTIEDVLHELNPDEAWFDPGIAAEYGRWVSKLQISCTLRAEALHWQVQPGHRVSFNGILSPWAAYDAVVQSVERDLFRESASITTGPRRHLGLDQLFELAKKRISETPSTEGTGDQPPPGGGGGDPVEPEPGTISRTIIGPNSEAVPGAFFSVGAQSAASEGSISLPPGNYTVAYWVPPDFVPPAVQTVNLGSGGNNTSTVTATYRDRLRIRRADGEPNWEIDMNCVDLVEGDGNPKVKLVEYHVVINGALKKAQFLSTGVPYSP